MIDRIDAHRQLAGEFQAPDFIAVAVYHVCRVGCANAALVEWDRMLQRSLCGSQEVVLYKGDYWPVYRDVPGVGPYIKFQEA